MSVCDHVFMFIDCSVTTTLYFHSIFSLTWLCLCFIWDFSEMSFCLGKWYIISPGYEGVQSFVGVFQEGNYFQFAFLILWGYTIHLHIFCPQSEWGCWWKAQMRALIQNKTDAWKLNMYTSSYGLYIYSSYCYQTQN